MEMMEIKILVVLSLKGLIAFVQVQRKPQYML